jgi:hypothetical protein
MLGMLSRSPWARAEASDLAGIATAATADPNWLLSSILQSSVAMAAALATLWLWRMKERSRVLDACQLAHERVVAAERAFDLVNDSVERHAALSWLIDGMDQLVRTPDASLEFLLSRCGPWEYKASVLATVVAEAAGYVRNARAEIVDVAAGQPLTTDWDEFRVRHGLPVANPLQEMVYERVYLRLMKQRTNAVQALRHGWPSGSIPVTEEPSDQAERSLDQPGPGSPPGSRPADREGPAPRHSLVVTSAEAQRLEEERADIVRQMFEAATAEESAQAQLARATMGWSAKWYLAVTSYVGLLGIVLPSIVLTLAPTSLKAELRWLLFAAFSTVVVAVVSTFVVTIRVRGRLMLARRGR